MKIKNKIKKSICILAASLMIISFAGCSDETNVNLNADGSSTYYSKTTYSEKELNKLVSAVKNGDNTYSSYGIDADNVSDTVSDLKSQLKKEVKNGETYYYEETSKSFKNTSDLEAYLAPKSEESTQSIFSEVSISKNEAWFYSDFDIKTNGPISISSYFKIKMPNKITKTNGKILDDYTVEFNNLDNQAIKYIITDKATASWALANNTEDAIKTTISNSHIPSRITGLKVEYKTKSTLKVTWNFGSVDYQCDALGYVLQRKINNGAWKTVKTTSDTMKNSYIETKVKANSKYSYRVQAFTTILKLNSYGQFSKTASVSTLKFSTKPTVKVSSGKKKATIKVKKVVKNTSGYQIQCSQNKNFKNSKKVITKKTKANVSKLSSGKKYYFRVRTYKKAGDSKLYGSWSKTVACKIK